MYRRVNELLGTEYKKDSEIDWDNISRNRSLPENFIKEFQDKVDWDCISSYQPLSESFIKEFEDKVNWECISGNQLLSKNFIKENLNKINLLAIGIYQSLDYEIYKEIIDNENNFDLKDNLFWKEIATFQILDKESIILLKDKLFYLEVSKFQPLMFINNLKTDDFFKDYLDFNILDNCNFFRYIYQQTKEKGWFWGYPFIDDTQVFGTRAFLLDPSGMVMNKFYKIRIYWKDFNYNLWRVKNDAIKVENIIREVKGGKYEFR